MSALAFLALMAACITAAAIIAFRRESSRIDNHIALFLADHDRHRASALTRSAEIGARVDPPVGAGSTLGHPAPVEAPAQLDPTPGVGHQK
jgi:hypothetical protein